MNLSKIVTYITLAVFSILVLIPINIENTEIAAHIGIIKISLTIVVLTMFFIIGIVADKYESIIAAIMFVLLSLPFGHVLSNDSSIKKLTISMCENEKQAGIEKKPYECEEIAKPSSNFESVFFTYGLIVMSLLLTNQYIASTRKVNLLLSIFEEEHSSTDEEQINTKGRVASLVEKANTLCESPAVRVTVFIVGSILVLLIAFMLMYHASVKEGDNLNIKTKEIITTKI
ncbi:MULTISPECIES: hypothetical protein [Enterobacterales]|uniref:hypothetical protein n=1 Tax=Enterobacterales TaxID=91347 RepID=UPI00073570A1|nr:MULTISPECIES: hypothetical protein [Enterobacterales]EBD5840018.1 hypothetical protein [Salmonella enterica]EGD1872952.1 hypothetical protein [Escherichia coli]EIY3895429.1 hypothetical protein [Salmonella enterica subsp. enterica serovar Schwarzengrund]EJD6640701.1 hypothetical protein [Citrobacter freundii]MPU33929.1 hypothetical protein [Klebsiella quasipneumoniae]HDT2123128.1 hypothetical protein [Enterobacter roggenkampii]